MFQLRKKGQLRGCIGTFLPATENIYTEIVRNAIASATEDPRFPPVSPKELEELEYSVDILSPPEPVKSLDELDPKKIWSNCYKRMAERFTTS